MILGSGRAFKWFYQILRGHIVSCFSHYKMFIFTSRALGFIKTALRITLHSQSTFLKSCYMTRQVIPMVLTNEINQAKRKTK